MFISETQTVKMKNKGFTLIELLVVVAILGVLAVTSSQIVVSVLRSQNKSAVENEVKQNGDLLINKFERDVRNAQRINPPAPGNTTTSITLQLVGTAGTIGWRCTATQIQRQVNAGPWQDVVNTDPRTGVRRDGTCSFRTTSLEPHLVTFEFRLRQGDLAPNRSEFKISVPFRTSVGVRGTN